jgi:hypothetical protein
MPRQLKITSIARRAAQTMVGNRTIAAQQEKW